MRVVIADDSVLLREGLAKLLTEAGFDVVASVGDGEALLAEAAAHQPDIALVDIRMPPTFTHEGAQAALALRARWPAIAILLLSQSLESRYAVELARQSPRSFGYLLKDRVVDVGTLIDSLERVASGGTVLDPEVVTFLMGRRRHGSTLAAISDRERQVLELMAEGRSNKAIATRLFINEKTVETHISSIFNKLDLMPEADDHRRVLAVLAWLQDATV